MMMHHDEEKAIRRGIEGANFFGYSLGHFYVFGEHRPAAPTSGRSSSPSGPRWASTPRSRPGP